MRWDICREHLAFWEGSNKSYHDQAKKAKQAEIERKRAEVRKRMEEASKAKKAKKGFMTPERKKKLRVSNRKVWLGLNCWSAFFPQNQLLLRKKAAEELKKEQERKAAERRRIIEERCGKPKNIEDANEGIYTSYYLKLATFHSLNISSYNGW